MIPYLRTLCYFAAVFFLTACTTTPAETVTAVAQTIPTLMPTAIIGPDQPRLPTPTPTVSLSPTTTPTPLSPMPATDLPMPTSTPTPCPPGQVMPGSYTSPIAGEMRYRIYLPPCYGDDERVYPTVYLFPGNTHDETAWEGYGLVEAAEAAIQAGDIPPLLLVMSDGGWIANNTSGGPGSFEVVVLNDLIPAVEQTYCAWTDPTGRALGGLSRGGYWSLMIAFRQPELFVSVGGHSAALIDSHAGPDRNPQYTALSNDLGDLRIYLDIGEEDWLRPQVQQLHEDMTAAGIAHTWALNPGEHADDYWPRHVTDYIRWYGAAWMPDRPVLASASTVNG
jgi:enterochelin esterase-like enzyme